jgi:hypothetical protein
MINLTVYFTCDECHKTVTQPYHTELELSLKRLTLPQGWSEITINNQKLVLCDKHHVRIESHETPDPG